MTLQQQYNLIKEGKGDKAHFLKNAKFQFPNLFNAFTSYEDSVNVLKGKGLIAESANGAGGVVTGGREQDWVKIFKQNISEEVKAEEKKTSKEVEEILAHNFDYKDDKNIDNVYGQSFLHGFYTEMQDPKNEAKTVDEVKEIVRKNLASNRLHYTEDGMFGVKGVGYTTEAPGLGTPQEVKGPYKSSGMEPVKLREGMYGDSDGDYDEQEYNKKEAERYYKAYLGEKDPKKKAEYLKIAREYGSHLNWFEEDLPRVEEEVKNQFFSDIDPSQEKEPMVPKKPTYDHITAMLRKGLEKHVDNAEKSKIDKLKAAIREIILQELTEGGEKTAVIKFKSGGTSTVDFKNLNDLTSTKDNIDVDSIVTGAGQKIK